RLRRWARRRRRVVRRSRRASDRHLTMGAMVEVSGGRKGFVVSGKRLTALDSISFSVDEGEFVSIVGSSGCGKTTMLNIIAGLIKPEAGGVSVRGRPVTGVDRKVGYTFQQATLLPW